MDETKRFLRYVVPGLVLAVETTLLLFILDPEWTVGKLDSLKRDAGFGAALVALLASGGVGFILSGIHHTFCWCLKESVIDHRKLINGLTARSIVVIRDARTNQILPQSDSLTEAWVITGSLWLERSKTNKKVAGATPRSITLGDLAHSTGAVRVAPFLALMITFATAWRVGQLAWNIEPIIRVIGTIAVAFSLFWVHQNNYRRTGLLSQQFIDEVLADALAEERPVVTYVSRAYGCSNPASRQSSDGCRRWCCRLIAALRRRPHDP